MSEQTPRDIEQVFPPRTTPINRDPRFLVVAGTKCAIRRVSEPESEYRPFTTRGNVGFERFERWMQTETGNFYEFRMEGWLMLVNSKVVGHRRDGRQR